MEIPCRLERGAAVAYLRIRGTATACGQGNGLAAVITKAKLRLVLVVVQGWPGFAGLAGWCSGYAEQIEGLPLGAGSASMGTVVLTVLAGAGGCSSVNVSGARAWRRCQTR
jgi:hypothetical protein